MGRDVLAAGDGAPLVGVGGEVVDLGASCVGVEDDLPAAVPQGETTHALLGEEACDARGGRREERTPPAPPPVFALTAAGPLGILGLAHTTEVKHLYLAGAENLPGLGLEGELVSGWGVARLISGGQAQRTSPQRRMLLGG